MKLKQPYYLIFNNIIVYSFQFKTLGPTKFSCEHNPIIRIRLEIPDQYITHKPTKYILIPLSKNSITYEIRRLSSRMLQSYFLNLAESMKKLEILDLNLTGIVVSSTNKDNSMIVGKFVETLNKKIKTQLKPLEN